MQYYTEQQYAAIRAAREESEIRRTREIFALLSGRQDLRGVHALADIVSDQVCWAV